MIDPYALATDIDDCPLWRLIVILGALFLHELLAVIGAFAIITWLCGAL